MTTPRILRSPEARRDLLDIWASIADGFLARLSGAMEVIAYPNLCFVDILDSVAALRHPDRRF